MLVLGIDPGLSRCGYGVIAQEQASVLAVAAGIIRTSPDDPTHLRLLALRDDLRDLIAEYSPDVMALERVLFQVKTTTAIGVGQASGVALTEAASFGCEVAEYSPNQVKLAVAGHGRADKEELATMVKVQLGLKKLRGPADASDALAIALCHIAFVASKTQIPANPDRRLAAAR